MSAQYFRVENHTVAGQHIRHYPHATAHTEEDELQLCIKQYTPLDNQQPQPGDITIVAAHACGFGKELYEPLWDELYQASRKSKAFRIRSIWFADAVHQAESGLLNASKLGNDPSWFDHSLDLLQMINHFRREMPMPLVGFGHSLGGTQIIHLALLHPRLFSTLVLVDPIIKPRPAPAGEHMIVAYWSTFKRDTWPSQEEAEKAIRKNPVFRHWDPRVIDRYIKYGLRKVKAGDKAVTLTTSKHQEVWSIARPAYPTDLDESLAGWAPTRALHPDILSGATGNVYKKPVPFYRPEGSMVFAQLPSLRPHLLFITPTSSNVANSAVRAETIGSIGRGQGGNGGLDEDAVKEVVIDESDHFVAFSKPGEVASVASDWLGLQTKRRQGEAREWEKWASLPLSKKQMVDKHWKTWMRRHYGKEKPTNTPKLKSKI